MKTDVIKEITVDDLFDSIFIRQTIEPLLRTVKSIGSNIFNQSNLVQEDKAQHYIHHFISSEYIIQQIYLIEVYQSLLNISLDEKTQQWYECLNQLLEHCGWFIPFEDVCILCDRPSKFSLDSENRLHGEGEPAIQFADGYSLYFYHGVPLPERKVR